MSCAAWWSSCTPTASRRPVTRLGDPLGVLLMAYGTPANADDIERYYTDIRRGRPPTPELFDDLRRRYDAIGGASPLAERTRAQAAGLQRVLDASEPGRFSVTVGHKHAAPSIEEAVADLAARGARRLVGIVLAPHYSRLSVGEYIERAAAAAAACEPQLVATFVESWHLEPELLDLLA